MNRFDVYPVTPPAPDLSFTEADLIAVLQRDDLYDHLERSNFREPHRAAVPGRPDLHLRWLNVRHAGLVGSTGVGHLQLVEKHVCAYEAELRRLGSLSVLGTRSRQATQISIPKHATFHVPEDPYQNGGVLYTIVERLTNTRPLINLTGLHRQMPRYSLFLDLARLAGAYYIQPSVTGRYIREACHAFQYNSDLTFMDLDPELTASSAERRKAVAGLYDEVSELQMSHEQLGLMATLESWLLAHPPGQ